MKTRERPNRTKVSSVETSAEQSLQQRGKLNFLARFVAWLLVNLFLWPTIRPLIRRLRLFQFVFVVYPGTTDDITSYIPLWLHWKIRKILPLSVLGISTPGRAGKRGLTITLMYEPEELSKEELRLMLEKMERFARSIGAETIALAGRLPGVILGQGLPLDTPFLRGDRGGVFSTIHTLQHVLAVEKLSKDHTIGILGVGFLGGRVLRRLQGLGFTSLIGIDPRAKNTNYEHVLLTNNPSVLKRCPVVLVLTGKGSDIIGSIPYLQEGVVVVDDTHPQLPSSLVAEISKKGGRVYKAALGLDGVRFFPEIPGYKAHWLPGCVIEALVVTNGFPGKTQGEFEERGRELGLKPLFIHSKGGE